MERTYKPALVGNRSLYEAPPATRQQELEALRRVEAAVAESKRRARAVGHEVLPMMTQPAPEVNVVKPPEATEN